MKRLLIVAQADFGRHVDPYQYSLHLRDEYAVTYLCWDYGAGRPLEAGIRVIWVSRSGGKIRRQLRLLGRAIREIRSNRYALVFVVHFPLCSFLRLGGLRIPMVMDVRTGYVRSDGLLRWLNNALIRLESRAFRYVTVISESLGDDLKLATAKMHVLPLGAQDMGLEPKTFEELRLLYVGTLQHRHIERTVEGFALARKLLGGHVAMSYDIVGTGPEQERSVLLAAIQRSGEGDHVRYHGYVQHKALRPFFEQCNLGVAFIPITRYFHPQPSTKVIEYLLGGMPVIATATRENANMVTEERGVVHGDAPDGFAEALRTLWHRRKTYRSEDLRSGMMGSTWEAIVDKNLRPYLASIIEDREAFGQDGQGR
jgi:glycosyltransferase involved in cell wall biosynthesis